VDTADQSRKLSDRHRVVGHIGRNDIGGVFEVVVFESFFDFGHLAILFFNEDPANTLMPFECKGLILSRAGNCGQPN
jgi:hypothetical protein